jgi:hypothetical protein
VPLRTRLQTKHDFSIYDSSSLLRKNEIESNITACSITDESANLIICTVENYLNRKDAANNLVVERKSERQFREFAKEDRNLSNSYGDRSAQPKSKLDVAHREAEHKTKMLSLDLNFLV